MGSWETFTKLSPSSFRPALLLRRASQTYCTNISLSELRANHPSRQPSLWMCGTVQVSVTPSPHRLLFLTGRNHAAAPSGALSAQTRCSCAALLRPPGRFPQLPLLFLHFPSQPRLSNSCVVNGRASPTSHAPHSCEGQDSAFLTSPQVMRCCGPQSHCRYQGGRGRGRTLSQSNRILVPAPPEPTITPQKTAMGMT